LTDAYDVGLELVECLEEVYGDAGFSGDDRERIATANFVGAGGDCGHEPRIFWAAFFSTRTRGVFLCGRVDGFESGYGPWLMGCVRDFPAPLDGVCVTGLNSLKRGADLRRSLQ
jgi:hypothetical protein